MIATAYSLSITTEVLSLLLDLAVVLGQHVLERTAVLVSHAGDVEGRFTVGLPAQGRSIMGPWAAQILTQHIVR